MLFSDPRYDSFRQYGLYYYKESLLLFLFLLIKNRERICEESIKSDQVKNERKKETWKRSVVKEDYSIRMKDGSDTEED